MCDARRQGDADPSQKIQADTAKIIGNSCYGETIVNKDKHRQTVYVEGHSEASNLIGSSQFHSLNELAEDDDGFYEASLFKNRVSITTVLRSIE